MNERSRAADLAHAQRTRALRALSEARAASLRLREARERAEHLLHAADSDERAPDRLRTRMHDIESRMQATDTLMRSAERNLAHLESEAARRADAEADAQDDPDDDADPVERSTSPDPQRP